MSSKKIQLKNEIYAKKVYSLQKRLLLLTMLCICVFFNIYNTYHIILIRFYSYPYFITSTPLLNKKNGTLFAYN